MIDFYVLTSPNVQKIFIMLEELAVPYRPIPVDVWKGEQFKPEFTALNPNAKIPVIVDHEGPGGRPSSALANTMTRCRPGNRLIASAPPSGAPIAMATTVAERLTRNDSATIPTSSGSRLPSRAKAAAKAWAISDMPAYLE